jgi:hypothetical protein
MLPEKNELTRVYKLEWVVAHSGTQEECESYFTGNYSGMADSDWKIHRQRHNSPWWLMLRVAVFKGEFIFRSDAYKWVLGASLIDPIYVYRGSLEERSLISYGARGLLSEKSA